MVGPSKKKGKQKLVFGVNNRKWYQDSSDQTSIESLKMAAQVRDFKDREKIFVANRAALMKMIRFVFINLREETTIACPGIVRR